MRNNKIPVIIMMSTNSFVDKIEDIRSICKKYEAKEVLDGAANTILFYFCDNESWLKAKQEIQLLVVERINFKLSPKRVIIMEEMKDIIVEPPQPPAWFLGFQQAVFARFDKQDKRFDKIEADIKKTDTTQPTWFTEWVKSDFDPLKKEVKKIGNRLDRVIKLNNLKE